MTATEHTAQTEAPTAEPEQSAGNLYPGRDLTPSVTERALDPGAAEAAVVTPQCGAALTFTGIVRDHDPEATGTVTGLDYTAHPDAAAALDRIAARHSRGPVRVAAAHRIGHLDVGEIALVVSVASPHRAESFETCRAVMEQIKAEVPIWKRQFTATGQTHWVGLP